METTFQQIAKVLSQRSLQSGFHMTAMIAAIAELFFLSDGSDHMETRLWYKLRIMLTYMQIDSCCSLVPIFLLRCLRVVRRKLLIGDINFTCPTGDRTAIFTWSFDPREGLAVCRLKVVPSFPRCFKTSRFGPF